MNQKPTMGALTLFIVLVVSYFCATIIIHEISHGIAHWLRIRDWLISSEATIWFSVGVVVLAWAIQKLTK